MIPHRVASLGIGALLAAWLTVTAAAAPAATGKEVMVATAHPLATDAALEVLAAGGNAVDAACAAQFALCVVEPQYSGLGGGGFLLFWDDLAADVRSYDGRETAPASATPTMFLDEAGKPVRFWPERITGGRPVGVPGTPALMRLVLARHGSLTLAQVIAPALRLAEVGFPVGTALHEDIVAARDRVAIDPVTRATFLDADGEPLRAGAWMKRPDLARTFRHLATAGLEAIYQGELARAIVTTINDTPTNPGRMTLEDLAAYRVLERRPVRSTYRGFDVVGMGPPSSGATTIAEILNLLEPYELSHHAPGDAELVHLVSEASRLAFADRNRYLGDADQTDVPIAGLVSKGFAASRGKSIGKAAATSPPLPGNPYEFQDSGKGADEPRVPATTPDEDGHTSHLVVADAAGGIVCWTTTIESGFGAALTVPGWGILLNNELTDFDAEPTFADGTPRPNAAAPGKRPRSSMSPTFLLRDGRPWAALGSPGGSRIIGIVTNVIIGLVDLGLDMQQAIDMPRTINRNASNLLTELEAPLLTDTTLRRALRARGHVLADPADAPGAHWGAAQGIRFLKDGTLQGGADRRRGGKAAGW